jgi:hypothetical protein
MTVYVDDMHLTPMGQFGRMKMCHMLADTTEDLLAMADTIGVQRKWLQKAGTPREHFDIASALAVKAGAVEITMSKAGSIVRAKRTAPAAKPPGCKVGGIIYQGGMVGSGMCGAHLVGGGCGYAGQCTYKEGTP